MIAKHIITVDAKDIHTDVQYSTIDTENVWEYYACDQLIVMHMYSNVQVLGRCEKML